LNTARVSENYVRATHQINKRQIIQRFYEIYVVNSGQKTIYWLTHIGIEMHGIDYIHSRVLACNLHQGFTYTFESTSEIFTAMTSHQNQLALWRKKVK